METKFQTSFIPKKPVTSAPPSFTPSSPRRPTVSVGGGSLFMTIAVVLFIGSILGLGGSYFYKDYLQRSQDSYRQKIEEKIRLFDLEQISVIKAQSAKIVLARQILNNHLASSGIFDALGRITAENTRFTSFEFRLPVNNAGSAGLMQITLKGYSKSFPSLAFQSDVLNQLDKYQLRSVIRNPIITDPTIGVNGTVQFSMTAQVDPTAFSYVKMIEEQSQQ